MTERMNIISRMGYSTSLISSVSLKVNDHNLSKRLTPPRLQDILVLGRQLPTYIGMCTIPKCKNMLHDMLEDVYLVVPKSPIIVSKVYTIPYLYPLDLGKAFSWILWDVYQQP
jgi:hypothetical protein